MNLIAISASARHRTGGARAAARSCSRTNGSDRSLANCSRPARRDCWHDRATYQYRPEKVQVKLERGGRSRRWRSTSRCRATRSSRRFAAPARPGCRLPEGRVPAWRHVVPLALIEGIGEGKADVLHKGTITVSGLDVYIAEV